MSRINPITINISLATLAIGQKSFGIPLLVDEKPGGYTGADYMEIQSLDDLPTDFTSTSALYQAANMVLRQSPRPQYLAIFLCSSWATVSTDLTTLVNSGKDDWYYLLITSRANADILGAADWIASREKIFFGSTWDSTVLDNRSGSREVILLHRGIEAGVDGDDTDNTVVYPEAAWVGATAPKPVGSFTYAYKKLDGIVGSGYTPADTTTILNGDSDTGKGNVVADYKGIPVTWEGKVSSGEYVDIIVSRDYIKARLEENLAKMNINADKIPYTQGGLRLYEASMMEVLNQAGDQGIIAPVESEDDKTRSDLGKYQYKIDLPETIDSIDSNTRANRKIPISFSLRIAGAVHYADIEGVISN